jgi:L-ascorbate metabolism protein UlaG (beta-lactamase superfamily)
MKRLLLIFLFAFSQQVISQDIIKTTAGDLIISPVLHGSLVLQLQELTIYVDPYGGAEKFESFPAADLILITDIHGDHLNKETLQDLNTSNTIFIVPHAVLDNMKDIQAKDKIVIDNGEQKIVNNINIEAIPMYNLPETADSRHTKGRGNGYILTIGDKKVYISGDTEDIEEMRNLTDIDIAFVCMNEPYTMTINQAAEAVKAFKPTIVYPFHFRGQGGLADVNTFKELVEKNTDNVEVRLRNWYPEN